MNTVAIYCRVDSGCSHEALQTAVAMQKKLLEQYACTNMYHISGMYEDIGCPGSDLSRPGLLALKTDYEKGRFDAVLVTNRSRLYRGNAWNETNWPFPVLTLYGT